MTQTIKSTEQPAMTLGQLFRQTRESLNLSLEDVSSEIRLRPSILRHLETDSFMQSSIPTTFLKGYIRGYAKFLRIPEEDWGKLVPTLDETTHNDLSKNTRSTQSVNQYSSHNHHRWMTYITLLIVFVVAGMTALWWWENYQQSNQERETLVQNYEQGEKTSEQNSEKSSEKAIIDNNGTTITVGQATNNGNQPVATSDSTTSGSVTSGSATLDSSTSGTTTIPVAVGAAATENISTTDRLTPSAEQAILERNQLPTNGANSALNQSEPISSAQTLQMEMNKLTEQPAANSSEGNTSAVALTGDLQIEITEGSCWISVKDANRKVLAQKEYMKGEVLNFNGVAPYSLIIGAPGNVKITYKGELFPLKVDGRVAKFKLE